MRGILVWSALLLIAVIPLLCFADDALPTANADKPSDWQERQFDDHIMLLKIPLSELPHYYFTYEVTGVPAPWERIPGGGALKQAAHYYALLTQDYDVSLSDIIEAGFWPYDTFPAGTDLELRLNWPETHVLGNWDEVNNCPLDQSMVGSNRWLIESRASLLALFYTDYYYTIIDTVHERNQEIGARFEQFWTNPYTGTLMKPDNGSGELQFIPVTAWRSECTTRQVDLAGTKYEVRLCSYEDFVRLVNEQNSPDTETVSFRIDFSTMDCDPPLDSVVTGTSLRSDLETTYNSLIDSLSSTRLREDLLRQGKLDFNFSVPQINLELSQQQENSVQP